MSCFRHFHEGKYIPKQTITSFLLWIHIYKTSTLKTNGKLLLRKTHKDKKYPHYEKLNHRLYLPLYADKYKLFLSCVNGALFLLKTKKSHFFLAK